MRRFGVVRGAPDVVRRVMLEDGWIVTRGVRSTETAQDEESEVQDEVCGPGEGDVVICWEIGRPEDIYERPATWRVNRIPAMKTLGAKDRLQRYFAAREDRDQLDFVPRTFLLPEQLDELKQFAAASRTSLFICKPSNLCAGKVRHKSLNYLFTSAFKGNNDRACRQRGGGSGSSRAVAVEENLSVCLPGNNKFLFEFVLKKFIFFSNI